VSLVLTERAQRVLALAHDAAESSGAASVGTEHLLVGLLREADGPHWWILDILSLDWPEERPAVYRDALSALRSLPGRGEVVDGEATEIIDARPLPSPD
jgi:ClpA/ClpB-like protein